MTRPTIAFTSSATAPATDTRHFLQRTAPTMRWIVIVILLTACSPVNDSSVDADIQAPPAASSNSQLPMATLPDGTRLKLELALTAEEISRGLMFRPSLPDDRGMLFLFDEERVPSFWMKNTIIALDLVFLDSTGRVVDIIDNAQPCAADPCPNYIPSAPAQAVIELAAGNASQHGLQAGDLIEFQRVEGFPVRSASQIAQEE